MTTFTPFASLAGGALIGAAAVMLMAFNGRIAGVTGILAGLLPPAIASDWAWRAAFIAGLVASPALYFALVGGAVTITVTSSMALLVVSGLIVGVGVTFGSGCTSGHGVCGLARLSPRSVVATLTFMATAALTVFLSRHVLGG